MDNENDEILINALFELTMGKKWKQVAEMYRDHWWVHGAKLTKSKDTALHVAVLSYNSSDPSKTDEFHVKQMISYMSKEALSTENEKGDTPLHLAAAVGWTCICCSIAEKHNNELIKNRNAMNETPLFVAARYGKQEAFVRLHEIYLNEWEAGQETGYSLCRRNDGNTALHSALQGECFDLANQIISYYPKLVDDVNLNGESPLHVLVKKPSIFKSVTELGFWDSLICKYAVEEQVYCWRSGKISTSTQDFGFPKNYRTCVNIFYFFWTPVHNIIRAAGRPFIRHGENNSQNDEENQQVPEKGPSKGKSRNENDVDHSRPANYTTLIMLLKLPINIILTIVGVGLGKMKKIERHKTRYLQALDIITTLLKYESSYKYVNDGQQPVQNTLTKLHSERIHPPAMPPSDEDHPKSEARKPSVLKKADTSFIVAAKMGIPDVVERIFSKLHIAIYDLDSMGRNVLMLAAKHRQMAVFDLLLSTNRIPEHVFHHVDNQGNNIIHLAAMLEDHDKPWRIPGAALQMQWEIKWFEYVKASVPSVFFSHHINTQGETPEDIFTKKHEKLMNQGYLWLIKTSESCSLIAALIAGAAFTTSAAVPGGINENTGYPILEGQASFDVFSISSLVAFSLAVTALVFFLAIITSRCIEHDFKSYLPNKLLNGLTCLFASIAAMLVAFCAGHTFVLKDQLKFTEIPIYAVACVPVSLYAMAQLPLYADLLKAVCLKGPLRSHWTIY